MKLTYDPRYNIAYVQLRPKNAEVSTLHLSDEVNIDIGSDGKLYGIELLNANEQLQEGKVQSLIIANSALGKTQEVPLQ